MIAVLTLLSPRYGSSNIFVDLGIVAVYGNHSNEVDGGTRY
jgi:hypothetical protein